MCPTKGCYYVKGHSGACAPALQADLATVKEGIAVLRDERDRLLAELAEARKDSERALAAKEADCAGLRKALESVQVILPQSGDGVRYSELYMPRFDEVGALVRATLTSGSGEKLLAEHAAELDRLRAALKRYGRHDHDCNGRPPAQILRKNCTCGRDAALDPPAGEPR